MLLLALGILKVALCYIQLSDSLFAVINSNLSSCLGIVDFLYLLLDCALRSIWISQSAKLCRGAEPDITGQLHLHASQSFADNLTCCSCSLPATLADSACFACAR